ncbi:MAG: hypothetical protein V5B78_13470, partial [Desulfohalobiaceae bacterium]
CSAGFEDAIGKVFISRTTRARTFMKHGPSARPVEPRLFFSLDNSTSWIHFHTKFDLVDKVCCALFAGTKL